MPKLSVIVPVYNTEKYLRECIDSILAQTFTDFELILVDDGSTDGSGAICDEYAQKDERIQVIHQENGGVTKARKAAMRVASGPWVGFVDSDDWISPDMYHRMLEKALSSAAQIVICDAFIEYGDRYQNAGSLAEEGVYDKTSMIQRIYPNMIMDEKKRRPGIAGWLCNKLFDKDLLETVFWEIDDSYVYSEDALCSYAALLECEKIYILRKPFYHYRQHDASAVHQYNGSKRYPKALYAYYAFERVLQNRGVDLTDSIYMYIAVNSVGIIRKVLLFDRQTALYKRIEQARRFASDRIVQLAISATIQKFEGSKDRWKTILVWKQKLFVLYVLVAIRYCTLENKE